MSLVNNLPTYPVSGGPRGRLREASREIGVSGASTKTPSWPSACSEARLCSRTPKWAVEGRCRRSRASSKIPRDIDYGEEQAKMNRLFVYSKPWFRGTGGLTTYLHVKVRPIAKHQRERHFASSPCHNMARTACPLSTAPVISRYVGWRSGLSNLPSPGGSLVYLFPWPLFQKWCHWEMGRTVPGAGAGAGAKGEWSGEASNKPVAL